MARRTLSLAQRPGDRVFIAVFAMFLTIAVSMDYINAVGDIGGLQSGSDGSLHVEIGITPEKTASWAWPPKPVLDAFFWWCDFADPGLQVNPAWMKYLALLSPFVFAPFYVFAMYSFATGLDSFRMPGIVWAVFLFTDLSVIIAEQLFGDYPSPRKDVMLAAYGPYLIFPLILGWRLRSPYPFSVPKKGKKQ